MSSILVRAAGLGRTYDANGVAVVALRDADFDVESGDRIALVGPSGSGKSTMLHLIAGIDVPTTGSIEWPGLGPVEALRPGPVAVAFQGPSLLPPLDIVENVALPILLAGGSEKDARGRATEMLERFGLSEEAARFPEDLSGGQLQRAGIARALVGRPKLLLADEPTGQQDREGGVRTLDALLGSLGEIPGAALLVATHDKTVAARMQQRWRIDSGALQAMASKR